MVKYTHVLLGRLSEKMRKRDEYGQFSQKSNEPREVRSLRLTNSTWETLGEIAEETDVSRADVIEEFFKAEILNQNFSKTKIQQLVEEILNDPEVTRKGKDKSAIKRGLEALLKKLTI